MNKMPSILKIIKLRGKHYNNKREREREREREKIETNHE
jgi:hypothetical protein